MSTSTAASRSFSSGSESSSNEMQGISHSSPTSPSSYSYVLARESDPYHPHKSIRDGKVELMNNICAMIPYVKTSPEELRLSWYNNENPLHSRDTREATSIAQVHLDGSAMRDWEMEVSFVQSDISDRSPALSTSSLDGTTRPGSPALTTSSESTIKASSFARNGRVTPAVSEIGTPVLTTRGLPAESVPPQTPSSKGKETSQVGTLVKRFSSSSLGKGEPSTPANITGSLWGRSSSSSTDSSARLIPPSPAAERYPGINTVEREWEAALCDARHKKALLEEAQAAYNAAVAVESAKFKAYSEARIKFNT